MTSTTATVPLATPATSGKYMVLLAAFLGWMFDGLEMGLFPLVARPALLALLGSPQNIGAWTGRIIAAFLVGAALGGMIFGWLGDRIGRVRAMVWSVLVYSIFSGLCGFSQTPGQLLSLRFLAALGMGGEWSLGVALVMEIWPNKSRPLLAGLIGAAANVGMVLIGLLGLVLNSFVREMGNLLHAIAPANVADALMAHNAWRLLLFLGAAPALLTFFIRIFVPESHRWQQAAATSPKNRLSDIFAPNLIRVTILATLLSAIALLGTWGSVQWIPLWADKLGGASARATAQIFTAGGAIFGCILAALFAQWSSRRRAYFALALTSLITCEILFRGMHTYGRAYLFWVFIVGATTAGFYGWLPLYLPELFPTRIRATAQGFAFNFGRTLAAAGTLLSGRLLDLFKEDYAKMASVITLVYVLGLAIIWLGPETKGRPLPP